MRVLLAAIACSLVLGGCLDLAPRGPTATTPDATSPTASTPNANPTTSPAPTSKLAQAQATHEYPSPAAPRQSATDAAPSALEAIRAFATGYVNWTASTLAADSRRLAAQSIGQARAMMTLVAAQTTQDYELQRGGIANQGTVEATARLAGSRNRYVVVTRELTTATNNDAYQGLRPAWHLAIATVTQQGPTGWVLSGWQPEN